MRFGKAGRWRAISSEDFGDLLREITGKERRFTDLMSAINDYRLKPGIEPGWFAPIPRAADARWRTRPPCWIALPAFKDARFLPGILFEDVRRTVLQRIKDELAKDRATRRQAQVEPDDYEDEAIEVKAEPAPEPKAPQAEPETHPVASQKQSRPDRPNVFDRDGALLTSSLDVAEWFVKDHRKVMRTIEQMRPKLAASQSGWFVPGKYTDSNNREQDCFFMNRAGFTILAMRFTGERALAFQVAYIDEFERMDAERKARALPPPVGQPSNEMTTIQQRMAMMDQQMAMMVRWMESGTQQISVLTTTTTALVALMTQLVEGQQQQVQQPATVAQPQRPPESNVRQMHDMRHPGWVTLTRFTKDTQIDGNTVRAFGFAHGMLRRTAENDITSDLRDNSSLIVYCPQEINGRVKPGWCITQRGYHELPHLIRQWMGNKPDEQDQPDFDFSP